MAPAAFLVLIARLLRKNIGLAGKFPVLSVAYIDLFVGQLDLPGQDQVSLKPARSDRQTLSNELSVLLSGLLGFCAAEVYLQFLASICNGFALQMSGARGWLDSFMHYRDARAG